MKTYIAQYMIDDELKEIVGESYPCSDTDVVFNHLMCSRELPTTCTSPEDAWAPGNSTEKWLRLAKIKILSVAWTEKSDTSICE